jgi:mono/diheme cytochrome c family protein
MIKLFPKPIFILLAIITAAICATGLANAGSLAQSAQQGAALFDQKCRACHNIGGGDLVGPDLKGVTERRDMQWLRDFISAPDRVIASGDPIATELLAKYNNLQMPNPGLSKDEVDALLAYLESPGGVSGAGAGAGAAALAGDAGRGKALFSGQTSLQNNATNCIACHSVNGLAALGGGTLGPDLTGVVGRYGGEAGMAGVLASLPFPTMQGIFNNRPLTPQEQADLLAYLAQSGGTQAASQAGLNSPWFWVIGAGGALVLFIVMTFFWPGQRKSISDRLRAMG